MYWKQYHSQSLCPSSICPPFVRGNLTEKPDTPALFSQFRYRKVCGEKDKLPSTLFYPAPNTGPDNYSTIIEPLTGPLRHPHFCTDLQFTLSKEYMFFSDPWLVQQSPEPVRFLYFDAGASTWTSGGGGASQNWIVMEFASRWCMTIAGIWAWEVTTLDTNLVFSQIPTCLAPVYHWYNVPVTPERSGSSNIWRHVEAMATPEDFVVVKIDIDNAPIETLLLQQLASTKSLQLLVDEMFFEHHVNFQPICNNWGVCQDSTTYKSSLELFTNLRKAGIRIHSWV